MSDELKPCASFGIGDEVCIHGYVDEIHRDTVIIRNDGGYFGTVLHEVTPNTTNTRADDAPEPTCELEETESYECRRFDTADPKLYATRLTVHVLECSECGRTCEHVYGDYERCPHCGAVNVLHDDYANDALTAEPDVNAEPVSANDGSMAQADSREKLEADVMESCEHFYTTERRYDELIKLLDRQAAITERECMTAAGLAATEAPALQAKVDSLTAERDELRDKLDEKQHVCDVQRDSFLKLEIENAELRKELDECSR